MVEFLKVQYRLCRITEINLDKLVKEGKITEEDKITIISY